MPSRPVFLLALLLALPACNFAEVALTPSASQSGIHVSATPIQLVIPAGLAMGVSADTIDVVTDQTGASWDIAPAHLQLTLQGYVVGNSFHVPQLFVYPAQQYAAMNPAAAESLKRLQAVLSNPSGVYDKDTLPRVPFLNAGQVLAAQQKVIQFSGGSGVRFITQYAQDVSPINNNSLFYHFAGLTSDGKTYIVAILPVNLPFLASDNDPSHAVSASGIPFPAPSASPNDFNDYYRQAAARIDSASAGQFTPPLATLDALIQSLTIDH